MQRLSLRTADRYDAVLGPQSAPATPERLEGEM
jgi:hypothetical protein